MSPPPTRAASHGEALLTAPFDRVGEGQGASDDRTVRLLARRRRNDPLGADGQGTGGPLPYRGRTHERFDRCATPSSVAVTVRRSTSPAITATEARPATTYQGWLIASSSTPPQWIGDDPEPLEDPAGGGSDGEATPNDAHRRVEACASEEIERREQEHGRSELRELDAEVEGEQRDQGSGAVEAEAAEDAGERESMHQPEPSGDEGLTLPHQRSDGV